MTFLEAAIEVLRHEDGALHYGEIARKAVDRKLLSHVGRDPEAAMKSCLMSAVRGGAEAAVERVKPGHYQVRAGASLPELTMPDGALDPGESAAAEAEAEAEASKKTAKKSKKKASKKATKSASKKSTKKTAKKSAKKSDDDGEASDDASAGDADADDAQGEADQAAGDGAAKTPGTKVQFEAPAGSGLDGVTDVALVMANAMSRLADERPELREELEAMQQGEAQVPEIKHKPTLRGEPGQRARQERGRPSRDRNDDDDRGASRRRRRRRRRTKRVEWNDALDGSGDQSASQLLLEKAEKALGAAGSRSLHVRQVAEALSGEGILGGEISEIERAVTAAILLDVQRLGDRSRFVPRGDARYQLRASRVPEKVAAAENALRSAWLTLESETRTQLRAWLGSLGARALETLVRMHLDREGYRLVATLPPGRGLAKLLIEDNESDGDRILLLVVPRKTAVEARLWEEDPERNKCNGGVWVVAMGDPREANDRDVRTTGPEELADWLIRERIGVKTLKLEVPVLDPTLIESIAGLDT